MKYEIDIDEKYLTSRNGVKFEPTGEFRPPISGEMYFNTVGMVPIEALGDVYLGQPRIILRPVWTWPEWLGGYCFAMNENGGMLWHSTQCQRVPNIWLSAGHQATMSTLVAIHPGFTPPTITDWTKPTLNPRWKQPNV